MTSFALTKVQSPEPVEAERLKAELALYIDMLSYMRPAGTKVERRFIRRFIAPLGASPDQHGNYWLVIPHPQLGQSQVMWSCHTDTVHRRPGRQVVSTTPSGTTAVGDGFDCLGADCTTGVWLMRQMILAQVPGVYIFHRLEEVGGRGSAAISRCGDKRLDGAKFAIALDRRGTDSVITHQMYGRCCSQAFVDSIVGMLPAGYSQDATGSFTDTANYVDLIPECTNISVGYDRQHTAKESQDLEHMVRLALALVKFDETKLVAERDPSVVDEDDYDVRNWTQMVGDLSTQMVKPVNSNGVGTRGWQPEDFTSYERAYSSVRTVLDIVREYPNEVADLLEQGGYDVDGLMSDMGLWRH